MGHFSGYVGLSQLLVKWAMQDEIPPDVTKLHEEMTFTNIDNVFIS